MTMKKRRQRWMFPWWCLFIAYACAVILFVTSIFFIIIRGIEFGDVKTQKWLISLITGFFCSILLIQPFKVIILCLFVIVSFRTTTFNDIIQIFLLTIFFAYCLRKSNYDEEAAEFIDDEIIEWHSNANEDFQSPTVMTTHEMRGCRTGALP
jgi:hypothetical protein